MYSVVLLAAMAAGEAAPDHHKGYPAHYGACYGIGYVGWHGWHPGCHGGWGLPYCGYGPSFAPAHGPHDFPPGDFGPYAFVPPQPPWPGYACFGGCGGYASPAFGLHPPTLDHGPVGPVGPPPGRDGDYRKDGGGKDDTDSKDRTPDKLDKDSDKKDTDKDDVDKAKAGEGRARLIVNLPGDARLYVDEQLIRNAADRKTLHTPRLRKGEQYFYDLRAEVVRDGKTVTLTKRVMLGAGDTVRADFSNLGGGAGTGVASAEGK